MLAIQTSAGIETLVYATGGKELLMEAVFVDIVSKVVTPRATLAGTAWKEIVNAPLYDVLFFGIPWGQSRRRTKIRLQAYKWGRRW